LIGQDRIKSLLLDYITNETLPRFMMFVGGKGYGKKELTRWLADKMGSSIYQPESLKVNEIRKMVDDSHALSTNKLYLLADAEEMTVQAQNALLKFIEEPPRGAYIVITLKQPEEVLETIKSRASQLRLQPYTLDELRQVTDNESILKLSNSIGDIKYLEQLEDPEKYHNLANKLVSSLSMVSTANLFKVLDYLDDNTYSIFVNAIISNLSTRLRESIGYQDRDETKYIATLINIVYEYKKYLSYKSLNTRNLLETMLVDLKKVVK